MSALSRERNDCQAEAQAELLVDCARSGLQAARPVEVAQHRAETAEDAGDGSLESAGFRVLRQILLAPCDRLFDGSRPEVEGLGDAGP